MNEFITGMDTTYPDKDTQIIDTVYATLGNYNVTVEKGIWSHSMNHYIIKGIPDDDAQIFLDAFVIFNEYLVNAGLRYVINNRLGIENGKY